MTRYHQRFKSGVPAKLWRKLTGSDMRMRNTDNDFTPHKIAVSPTSNDRLIDYDWQAFSSFRGVNDAGEITTPVQGTATGAQLIRFSADHPAVSAEVFNDSVRFRAVGTPADDPTHMIYVCINFTLDPVVVNLVRLDSDFNVIWQRTVVSVWYGYDSLASMNNGGTHVLVLAQTGDDSTGFGVQVYSYNASDGTMDDQKEYRWYDPAYSDWQFDLIPTGYEVQCVNGYAHIVVQISRNYLYGPGVYNAVGWLTINLANLNDYKLIKKPSTVDPWSVPTPHNMYGVGGLLYVVGNGGYEPLPVEVVTVHEDGQVGTTYVIDNEPWSDATHIEFHSAIVNQADSPLEIYNLSYGLIGGTQAYGTCLYSNQFDDTVVMPKEGEWRFLLPQQYKYVPAPYPYQGVGWGVDLYLYDSIYRGDTG